MGQSSKKQEINLLIPDISKMINWSKLFFISGSNKFAGKQGIGRGGYADSNGNIVWSTDVNL